MFEEKITNKEFVVDIVKNLLDLEQRILCAIGKAHDAYIEVYNKAKITNKVVILAQRMSYKKKS